jgi:hypothetical protein
MLSAAALGFLHGLRHALDPDHVAAVSSLAAYETGPWAASRIALSWGLGHGFTLLLAGALCVALETAVPLALAGAAELLIALLLVGFGGAHLRAAWRKRALPKRGDSAQLARSGAFGVAHGLAGSGVAVLFAAAAMPGGGAGLLAYLGLFALGTLLAMSSLSWLLGLPLASERARRGLVACTGFASLGVGALLLAQLARMPLFS